MSIFGKIVDKIFHHQTAQAGTPTPGAPPASSPEASPPPQAGAPTPAQPTSPGGAAVDVGAVLSDMASRKGGGGNYQQSIVDLLKLLDLDSSLEARKSLAEELGVHAGEAGTAEQNIALHKAVVAKLAENGGRVPDSMKH